MGKKKWRVKGKWRWLILFFFLWSAMIFLRSELIRVQFYFIFSFSLFDPSQSELIRSDCFACLAKMFVCPVPKISQVTMKWCHRASHLGRFTLWSNGGRRRASHLGRSTLWNNGRRRASHLGRFTLWNNQGHPTAIFGKISVRKTIWDLEFSEHLL